MNDLVNWKNPYESHEGNWYKGNLHTHTSPASGCAVISAEDCLNRYIELKYNFLSISDHMTYNNYTDDRISQIPGIEWNSMAGEHTGIYTFDTSVLHKAIEISDQTVLLEYLSGTDSLVILNHPNWLLTPHYRREDLLEKSCYHGIEVYNGVIERLDGYAISSDKWDFLLAQGKKVFGFANDDSHCFTDIGLAANIVRSKSSSPQDIFRALLSGNFYGSSGVIIDDIRMEDGVIEIETRSAQEIRAIITGGPMVDRVKDHSIRFDTSKCSVDYVRFECYGQYAEMAWTQPFFLK